MNRSVILPQWLDKIIFEQFEAKYHKCPEDVQYGPDQGFEHVLTYLGTYFPRSYTECFCIVERLLQNKNYSGSLYYLEELNILDFCCGTGGEILGAIMAYQKYLPNLKRINIDAFDANPWSIRILNRLYQEHLPQEPSIKIEINLRLIPMFVENELYLQDVSNIVNRNYQLIMSFKALNELVQSKTFPDENVYTKIADSLIKHIAENGLLLILDLSHKNKDTGVYYPVVMNKGLNDFVRRKKEFKTIIPFACYFREDRCVGCYMQDVFNVAHTRCYNEISKVAYRIICKRDFADLLMSNIINAPSCRDTQFHADKNLPYIDL